jgi:hypothetical protein
MPHILFGGVPPERAGEERLAFHKLGAYPTGLPALSSEAFVDAGPIPRIYTVEGEGKSPPLRWKVVPGGTRALALIVEDPDAPTPDPFVHWIVTGIPPTAGSIEAALAQGAHQGRNSMLRASWAPCAPPKGDEAHRYFFQLFALSRETGPVPGRSALLTAMRGCVLGSATLVGTFRR